MGIIAIDSLSPQEVEVALKAHLDEKRATILREPQGRLAHPYLVPGSYDQAWDWDTYFISVALAGWAPAHRHIRGTVENFYANMDEQGRAPRWVHPGKDFWTDPGMIGENFSNDLAKPFFAQTAYTYSQATGDASWFKPYLEKQRAFLDRWRKERMGTNGLHVWANALESGGDNHPDVFGWPHFSIEGVDLAVFLIREHLASAALAKACGEFSYFMQFASAARFLLHQMESFLFDPEAEGFFNRYRPTGQFVRIESSVRFYPLWLAPFLTIPVEVRRKILKRDLLNPNKFWGPHGIRSVSMSDPLFNNFHGTSPSNCQGPVWINENYIHLCNLVSCGYSDEALELAFRVQKLLLKDLETRGAMAECYHSETGEPLAVKGFVGWNLLALKFREIALADHPNVHFHCLRAGIGTVAVEMH